MRHLSLREYVEPGEGRSIVFNHGESPTIGDVVVTLLEVEGQTSSLDELAHAMLRVACSSFTIGDVEYLAESVSMAVLQDVNIGGAPGNVASGMFRPDALPWERRLLGGSAPLYSLVGGQLLPVAGFAQHGSGPSMRVTFDNQTAHRLEVILTAWVPDPARDGPYLELPPGAMHRAAFGQLRGVLEQLGVGPLEQLEDDAGEQLEDAGESAEDDGAVLETLAREDPSRAHFLETLRELARDDQAADGPALTLRVVAGPDEASAAPATATRVEWEPRKLLETWQVTVAGKTHRFQTYSDRRKVWTRQGGGVPTEIPDLWLRFDEE